MPRITRNSAFRALSVCALAVVGAGLLTSCGVNPRNATSALEAQGLKDVKIGSYSFFGCGRDDTFASNFSAIGANGKPVTGTVCQGLFKGTTVRFD
ncbi:hypothetical protein HNR26_003853 [Rhizobium rosettiformans]|uniref:Lipoprotein n=2 Tax=Rhizobium rosettiformans TaxID=1368430 RepID=A0A4S8PPR3_9HYPH|nr:hypothetical protein [Rhizobium rosettiformans]MBB5277764.1 hypothetical protein [Rhizobium rosettiformans]THV32927.1 hypothetical protein FAA86_18725 [Rhizobium rosettiformans W3]